VLSHRRPTSSQVFVQAEVAAIHPVPVSVTTIMRGHRARQEGTQLFLPIRGLQTNLGTVLCLCGCRHSDPCMRPCYTATATAELLEWSMQRNNGCCLYWCWLARKAGTSTYTWMMSDPCLQCGGPCQSGNGMHGDHGQIIVVVTWWAGLVASCLLLLCAGAVVLMEQGNYMRLIQLSSMRGVRYVKRFFIVLVKAPCKKCSARSSCFF